MKKLNLFYNSDKEWELYNCYNQLFLYFFSFFYFIHSLATASGRETNTYYFTISTLWLIIATVNCTFLKSWMRNGVGLLVIMVNTYIFPLAFYSYGNSAGIAMLIGSIYIIVTIILSPWDVSALALCSGICFSFLQKKYLMEVGSEKDIITVIKLGVAYGGLTILAFVWKLVIAKLQLLLTPAVEMRIKVGKTLPESNLSTENRLLKNQIAMHIIELDKITSPTK